MTDCNRGTGQPPVPRTNANSIHPPQGNADVPHVIQDFVGGPSTSIEILERACGDGSSTFFKKCLSKTCLLAKNNFKPSDKIVSTVTHRTYPCVNHEGNKIANCNTPNVIYLLTCDKCRLQYVGETAQNLNVRFGKHRNCMKGRINSTSCKRLSEHFSKGLCKDAGYTVQIVENWIGNGRTNRNSIDLGLATLRRKRESEWMLKLRTVHPFGLNERVDLDTENESFDSVELKNEEDMISRHFKSLPRQFVRNEDNRHLNRRGIDNIDYNAFLNNMDIWLTSDLPNAANKIRISLACMKKRHLKSVAEYINDYLSDKDSDFLHLTWYLMALDIIESKLFVEPTIYKKRPTPKYRCNLSFSNKALDFINLSKLLRSPAAMASLPPQIDKTEIPMIIYTLNQPIRSKIFNYNDFIKSLDLNEFVNNNTSIKCSCKDFDSSFVNNHFGHIITGDLNIVDNLKLKNILFKGPKYREPVEINWREARDQIKLGLEEYLEKLSNEKGLDKSYFSEWITTVLTLVDDKIALLKNKIKTKPVKPIFKDQAVKNQLSQLKESFVIVPIDKATNNIAFICKQFYANVLVKELDFPSPNNCDSSTYHQIHNLDKKQIIKEHKTFLKKLKIQLKQNMESLPLMYWVPKMHKNPVGFRFIIASPQCTLKHLAKDLTAIFRLLYKKVEKYNQKGKVWSGVNKFWIIQNTKPIIQSINNLNRRNAAKSLSTFDFSTLYTKIPHDKLKEVLNNIIDFAFKGGTREYIKVYNSTAYWTKTSSRRDNLYTREQIKESLKYLIDNSFFSVGSDIFRQVIGIPMGSDPAPFFANLFLYYYESKWLQSLKTDDYQMARRFGNVFRYIDDLLAINDNGEFERNYNNIYPPELQLKKENVDNDSASFLDLQLSITNKNISTQLFDKRNSYSFTIVRLPYKSSTLPSKMFFSTISAEVLRIGRATSSLPTFIETTKCLLVRMKRQGADVLGIRNSIRKMFYRHQEEFIKYSSDIESITVRLLE